MNCNPLHASSEACHCLRFLVPWTLFLPPSFRRLWDKVHSIHYLKPESTESSSVTAGGAACEKAASNHEAQVCRPVGLQGALLDLLQLAVLEEMPVSDATSAVLCVLRLVEVVNRQRMRLTSYIEKGR